MRLSKLFCLQFSILFQKLYDCQFIINSIDQILTIHSLQYQCYKLPQKAKQYYLASLLSIAKKQKFISLTIFNQFSLNFVNLQQQKRDINQSNINMEKETEQLQKSSIIPDQTQEASEESFFQAGDDSQSNQKQQQQEYIPEQQQKKQKTRGNNHLRQKIYKQAKQQQDKHMNKEQENIKNQENQELSQKNPQQKKYRANNKYNHEKTIAWDLNKKIFIPLKILFEQQIKQYLTQQEGFIRFGRGYSNQIKLFYTQQKVKERIVSKINDLRDNINVVEIEMKVQHKKDNIPIFFKSQKLKNRLKQCNMIIIALQAKKNRKQKNQNVKYNMQDMYYLCGKAPNKQLSFQIQSFKRNMYKIIRLQYFDTRSHRIILSAMLEFKSFLESLRQQYKIIDIEVLKKDKDKMPKSQKFQKLEVLLSLVYGSYIEFSQFSQLLSKIVRQKFRAFTIVYEHQNRQYFQKPKIQGVNLAYCNDKHINQSYIFVIYEKDKLSNQKKTLLSEYIKNIKVKVLGIRIFNKFSEIQNGDIDKTKYYIKQFRNGNFIYSWYIYEKNAEKKQKKVLDFQQFLKVNKL